MSLPPLVEPGPELSDAQRVRYARNILLPWLGEVGQRRLRAARIAVVGAGGLGSPALLQFAAAGVGHLTVIDDDVVDVTNLQRQVLHTTEGVGRPKAQSAADALTALNPEVSVRIERTRLTPDNAASLFAGHDLVLDCVDNFATRYVISDACAELGLPCVWAAVYETQAQVSVFWRTPPAGLVGTDLRDAFPEPPDPANVRPSAEIGVIGALTGQVGAMMAGEAVKLVCGAGDPLLGRIAFVDVLAASITHIPLAPRPRKVTHG